MQLNVVEANAEEKSLDNVKQGFMLGLVTKEEYELNLCAKDEMRVCEGQLQIW